MKLLTLLDRFFVPGLFKTLYCMSKYKSQVSPKAEIDLGGNLKLGKHCVVSSFTKIKSSDGKLIIGDRGSIEFGSFIAAGSAGITIGKNCLIGPNVSIIGNSYNYNVKDVNLEDLGKTSKGIIIGDNVWIGAGSIILDGTILGDNVIVTANSLVNRRYKADSIIQGSPAKTIMNRT